MKWIDKLKKYPLDHPDDLNPEMNDQMEESERKPINERIVPLIRDILNRLDVAVWSKDLTENKIIFVSNAIQDIYGIPAKEVGPDTWKDLIHPDDLNAALDKQAELESGDKIAHTYRILTANGEMKWVRDHTIAITDGNGKLVRLIGSLEEITESKKLQQKIRDLAYVDEMTKLPNRNAFRKFAKEQMEITRQEGRSFALLWVNIDHFNRVNDAFGHEAGDRTIKIVAERLSETLGEEGKVYHLASDEFLVYAYPKSMEEDYVLLAQQLLDTVKADLAIDDYQIHLTASIGISLFPSDGEDITTLAKNGRAALKRAKELGKGIYQIYSSSMNIESYKFFQLEGDLKKALDRKELYFEYQPTVDAKTQKALGAEALIRWKHQSWGVVSPAEFIKIAEEGYLIHQISDFVIESVCRQANEWEKQGVPFRFLSFNMSPKNFLLRDLADRFDYYLTKYKVNPEKLELEITEDILLKTNEVVEEQIHKLKKIGIKIAIDDYGVGYSSVFYLKQLPVNTIKIDRSFIGLITENQEDAVIVRSIIDLAKGLGKKSVAEGVETREQYDLLKKMGCDVIQGHLFSPSVSSEKIEKLFAMEKIQVKDRTTKPKVERRRYFRIDLPMPLSTEMTIVSLHNKSVSLGTTEVLVENIGPGGLRFMSQLRLTPHENIFYGFETEIMGTKFNLKGKIVWHHEFTKDLFNYGVEFVINENDRDDLTAVLNKVASKIRANAMLIEGDFITEEATTYLRKQLK